jgi:membrane protease YdiL (CAAX protease family)
MPRYDLHASVFMTFQCEGSMKIEEIRVLSGPTVRTETRPAFNLKALSAFLVLSYAFSWAWLIPLAVTGHTVLQGRGWPTHFPSLLGPMLAAFIVTAKTMGRSGILDLLRRMGRWRIGWRWWLIALSPLAFLGIALGVMVVTGATTPTSSSFAQYSGLPSGLGVVGVALVILVIGGFGEETGWRGYALPQLQNRFSPLISTLILAGFWAAWHIPSFFALQSYGGLSAGTGLGFAFSLACGAIVATWIYNRSGGSILAVVVWHGLYDAVVGTKAATGGSGTIAAVVSTFIIVQALVLVVLEIRAGRHGMRSVLGPP